MRSTLLVLVRRYNQAVISFYFFVCLFVVVAQFYKNRENSYSDILGTSLLDFARTDEKSGS